VRGKMNECAMMRPWTVYLGMCGLRTPDLTLCQPTKAQHVLSDLLANEY
jgi:hypothetical protein